MTAVGTPARSKRDVVAFPGHVAAYAGTVTHRRVHPARAFAPHLFLAYLDVDALPDALDPLPLWSARRPAPVQFRRRDFFDGTDLPLGTGIRDLVAERLGRRPEGRVFLLAHLRTFGWLFNPLAVYYCWNRTESALDAVVLEVGNTPWHDRRWYVFDAAGSDRGTATKAMFVSPFLPMDGEYVVSWTPPGAALALRVALQRQGRTIFAADLALDRVPLDRRGALRLLLRHPLVPLRVSLGIYREALALWLRRVPRFRRIPDRRPGGPMR